MFYTGKLEMLFIKNLTPTTGKYFPKNNSLPQKQLTNNCKRELQLFLTLEGLIIKSYRFHNAELPWYGEI